MAKIELLPYHCGLSVGDLDEAIAWFERVLGFELDRREDFLADQGIHIAFVRNGDFFLELFPHDESQPAPPERGIPNEDIRTRGTKHMCFLISDMEALLSHFRAHDVRVVLGPFEAPGSVACFIHGPDEILIEVIQER